MTPVGEQIRICGQQGLIFALKSHYSLLLLWLHTLKRLCVCILIETLGYYCTCSVRRLGSESNCGLRWRREGERRGGSALIQIFSRQM